MDFLLTVGRGARTVWRHLVSLLICAILVIAFLTIALSITASSDTFERAPERVTP